MGVLDNFLNMLKLNDDDDYDDDFYDDEDIDDGYIEKPKRSLFKKERNYDETDDYDDVAEHSPEPKAKPGHSSKVTPMRQSSRHSVSGGMEVCVIKPNSVEDAREITETLLSGKTVILNLEGLDLEIAQRIIDFTSGATYAIAGNLQKVSSYIFLVTPTDVDISGDLQDLLGSSFDVSSMTNHY